MSVISAGTTTTTAFKVTGDTTGTLQLQTGAVPTTAINISATQVVTFPATTTLDFTGTLRLSGGTANGVLYLNGSKDVTGGSTLTFDGTTFTSGAHTLSTGVLTVPAGTVSAPAITTSGDTNTGIFFPAADTIAFAEGGVEAARFDSSGNLNIGTTGYGNYSTLRKNISLGVGTNINAATSGIDPNLTLVANGYLDSTPAYKYIVGDPASYYEQYRGAHYWAIAPSGTAGSTISFTQAMTLTSGGLLQVSGGSTNTTYTSSGEIALKNSGSTPYISWHSNTGTRIGYLQMQSSGIATLSVGVNQPLVFETNATERARITAAGDVGIGTTSPAYKLDVNGGISLNAKSLIGTSGYFICGTNGFRWNNSTDAFNNVIMYDNGTTQFRNAISVGDVTPTTSGAGVTFPATQSASSNANTLDDYEEGTWTPVVRGSNTAGTYELQTNQAVYTKIGRQVTISASIQLSSSITGGGVGYAQIRALPFTKAADINFLGATRFNNVDFTGSYVISQFISNSATDVLYFSEIVDNGASIDLPISAFSASDIIEFTITYFV